MTSILIKLFQELFSREIRPHNYSHYSSLSSISFIKKRRAERQYSLLGVYHRIDRTWLPYLSLLFLLLKETEIKDLSTGPKKIPKWLLLPGHSFIVKSYTHKLNNDNLKSWGLVLLTNIFWKAENRLLSRILMNTLNKKQMAWGRFIKEIKATD